MSGLTSKTYINDSSRINSEQEKLLPIAQLKKGRSIDSSQQKKNQKKLKQTKIGITPFLNNQLQNKIRDKKSST